MDKFFSRTVSNENLAAGVFALSMLNVNTDTLLTSCRIFGEHEYAVSEISAAQSYFWLCIDASQVNTGGTPLSDPRSFSDEAYGGSVNSIRVPGTNTSWLSYSDRVLIGSMSQGTFKASYNFDARPIKIPSGGQAMVTGTTTGSYNERYSVSWEWME